VLLAKGFRPFFLLSALAAGAAMLAWLAALGGVLGQRGALTGISWHAHEMLFGFGLALLAGFLLTAVPNWTKLPAVTGPRLLALIVLWGAGRLAVGLDAVLPGELVMAVDVAFPLSLALVIAWPILRARSSRNYGIPLSVGLLAVACAASHAAARGTLALRDPQMALRLGVDLIIVIIVVIGGRIVPLFTGNALKRAAGAGEAPTVRTRDARDSLAVVTACAVVAVDAAQLPSTVAGALFGVAALAQGARMVGWRSPLTVREPLLWILHVGYAWVALGYLAKAAAAFSPTLISGSTATHTLAAGALGTFAVGMIGRVSMGHTGRPLVASKTMTAAFALVVSAGVARVMAALGVSAALHASATLWILAFAALAVAVAPVLLRPRPDGKPG